FTHAPDPLLHPPALHDALPISSSVAAAARSVVGCSVEHAGYRSRCWHATCWRTINGPMLNGSAEKQRHGGGMSAAISAHACSMLDRKSTRLNSSHVKTSYAVFC